MRIGMITQWYEPETGSAAHPTAIAQALHARGHKVEVLTGFPSYPLGHVHSGYSMRRRLVEERNGVRLLRVPDVPNHDANAVRRALSLTSFAASATAQVGWLRHVDACLVYLTPATVGMAAAVLKRLSRVPYVLYVQDLWPETVTASGFIGSAKASVLVERVLTALLARLYGGAAGIAAISPTMAATLADRGARTPPVSVPNWVDERMFAPATVPTTRQLPAGRTWIMYAGGIGEVQALQHAVRAIAALADRPDIGLALVGDGTALPSLCALARDLGVEERLLVLGSRPMESMPALMAEATAQLISLKDLPLFRGTIPSKLQASMACAQPVICAVSGDAADLVARTGAGLVVTPEDSEALAAAFRQVADLSPQRRRALGDRGREVYLAELSSEAGGQALETMLWAAATRGGKA